MACTPFDDVAVLSARDRWSVNMPPCPTSMNASTEPADWVHLFPASIDYSTITTYCPLFSACPFFSSLENHFCRYFIERVVMSPNVMYHVSESDEEGLPRVFRKRFRFRTPTQPFMLSQHRDYTPVDPLAILGSSGVLARLVKGGECARRRKSHCCDHRNGHLWSLGYKRRKISVEVPRGPGMPGLEYCMRVVCFSVETSQPQAYASLRVVDSRLRPANN